MEFINRKAQFPGRVKLVKVAGSTDLYDITLADGTFNTMQAEISTEINNSLAVVSQQDPYCYLCSR